MPLFKSSKSQDPHRSKGGGGRGGGGHFENCCKAPKTMRFDPPLPSDYSAWIHRVGWVLYVHEPTKQRSWMHPVKAANMTARGLQGPGELGPEMWIWERNVNREGYYVVDYGYPPFGRIVEADGLLPGDLRVADECGWEGWREKRKTAAEEHHRVHDPVALKRFQEQTPEDLRRLRARLAMRKKMMLEQGIVSKIGIGESGNDQVVEDMAAQELNGTSNDLAEIDMNSS